METQNREEALGIVVGVVGLGLMGSSIIASLLLSGHKVIAIAPLPADMEGAEQRIQDQLHHSAKTGLLKEPVEVYISRLVISEDYSNLKDCSLVMECVIEVLEIKQEVYKNISDVIKSDAIIASNTSAIPISTLQKLVSNPERFLGIHWSEPAYLTRFLEITCGILTGLKYAEWVVNISRLWDKEPTLLRKDIRGFITNRLMYAVYREGLDLIQKGEATIEDVDKAFRYDAGSWMTLMGIFRRMDFLGLQDSLEVLKNVYPKLCNDETVPAIMQEMVDKQARGIHNLKGLFEYSEDEAKEWEAAFAQFNEDIFKLAAKYPSSLPVEIKP
ncbi:MAG TPA: 3-hydroxyacyl-CoA dehydrogenase family protein [Sphingobacteriaceae bacterium]|nr:3-hydroxyacyl-CoA dehydrogenase family protein [Sphingobacteriaceae bacterium]